MELIDKYNILTNHASMIIIRHLAMFVVWYVYFMYQLVGCFFLKKFMYFCKHSGLVRPYSTAGSMIPCIHMLFKRIFTSILYIYLPRGNRTLICMLIGVQENLNGGFTFSTVEHIWVTGLSVFQQRKKVERMYLITQCPRSYYFPQERGINSNGMSLLIELLNEHSD